MNGVMGFADLLKDFDLTKNQRLSYLEIIQKSGARLLNLINDLIDISKIESGQVLVNNSNFDINEKLTYFYNFFRNEALKKRITLTVKTCQNDIDTSVYTDKDKVYAIMSNLLKNAIKYTDTGSIDFGFTKKDSILHFYVTDTGIGIDSKKLDAVFDRFMRAENPLTSKYEGAGLGLAITKAYVELLGGEISVESEIGKGSTFRFTLPFHPAISQANSHQNPVPAALEKQNFKVLIAEDEDISYQLLSCYLSDYSSEILHASTGTEAVSLFNQNPDIQIIMMDIKMPEMNGYEAMKQIRLSGRPVFIIAQSAYALAGDREKALMAGADEYIEKPIQFNLLKNIISNYILINS